MTLRVLSALLCLAYCGALRAAWRDRNGPLVPRVWFFALSLYASVYAWGLDYPTTGNVIGVAILLVLLQAGAVLEAAWRVTGLLSDRQRWAVLGFAACIGVDLWGLAVSRVPAPYPRMPAWLWYGRTGLALCEIGLLAASNGYVLAKLRRPNRLEAHAGVMLLWVGAAALGHAGAVGAVAVTAVHLGCAVAWWRIACLIRADYSRQKIALGF